MLNPDINDLVLLEIIEIFIIISILLLQIVWSNEKVELNHNMNITNKLTDLNLFWAALK